MEHETHLWKRVDLCVGEPIMEKILEKHAGHDRAAFEGHQGERSGCPAKPNVENLKLGPQNSEVGEGFPAGPLDLGR